jgi:hypothetical protein
MEDRSGPVYTTRQKPALCFGLMGLVSTGRMKHTKQAQHQDRRAHHNQSQDAETADGEA